MSARQQELGNLFGGLSAAEIRKLIVAHGGRRNTNSGPQYVACRCELCEFGREQIKTDKLRDAYTLDCNQYRQEGAQVPSFEEWRDAYRLPWRKA